MKKLGKLKLSPGKILGNDDLLTFRGGSGCDTDICNQCCDSAEIACEISCGGDSVCYVECVISQCNQCMDGYGCSQFGC